MVRVMVKAFSWIPKCKNQCIMYNLMSLKLHVCEIIRASKVISVGCRWCQWDLGGVKMSSKPSKWLFDNQYNRRTTRTELESVFCIWMYFHLRSKIFFWPSYRGWSPPSPPPPVDLPLISSHSSRVQLVNASASQPVGSYRCSKHRKSVKYLKLDRYTAVTANRNPNHSPIANTDPANRNPKP